MKNFIKKFFFPNFNKKREENNETKLNFQKQREKYNFK